MFASINQFYFKSVRILSNYILDVELLRLFSVLVTHLELRAEVIENQRTYPKARAHYEFNPFLSALLVKN